MKACDFALSLVTGQKDLNSKDKVEKHQNVKLILKVPRRFSF